MEGKRIDSDGRVTSDNQEKGGRPPDDDRLSHHGRQRSRHCHDNFHLLAPFHCQRGFHRVFQSHFIILLGKSTSCSVFSEPYVDLQLAVRKLSHGYLGMKDLSHGHELTNRLHIFNIGCQFVENRFLEMLTDRRRGA